MSENELVTEARIEVHSCGTWYRLASSSIGIGPGDGMPLKPLPETMPIPQAVTEALAAVRFEREREVFPDATPAMPVRVIDAANKVVAQWGKQ